MTSMAKKTGKKRNSGGKERGTARNPSPSLHEVLRADRNPAPPLMGSESYEWMGDKPIPIERYTSRSFYDLEVAELWPKVWQMACHRDQISEVGDYVVYDICRYSIIVLRTGTGPDDIRAFHNSCLHRGQALLDGSGHCDQIKCPFHGFTWNINGEFMGMLAPWDFPHVDADAMQLPEAQVASWGGFVFINMDPDAEPFETYAAPLADHVAEYNPPYESRYIAHYACQVFPANWKVTMEAFLEAYHVHSTHPRTFTAEALASSYDIIGTNVNRMIHPGPLTDRSEVAERRRKQLERRWRTDLSGCADSEILDNTAYQLFPNFVPWPTHNIPLCYRFRPWEEGPDHALMEVMLLHPRPDDGEYEVAKPHWLEPHESWMDAPGFEFIGDVLDEDRVNIHRIQKGLRAARHSSITLADYSEARIAHYHRRLGEQLGLDD